MRQKHVAAVLAIAGLLIVLSFFLILFSGCDAQEQPGGAFFYFDTPTASTAPANSGSGTTTLSQSVGAKGSDQSPPSKPFDWGPVIANIPNALGIIFGAIIGFVPAMITALDARKATKAADEDSRKIQISLANLNNKVDQQQILLENIEKRFNAEIDDIVKKYQRELRRRFESELNPDKQTYIPMRMDRFQILPFDTGVDYDPISQIRQEQRALERDIEKPTCKKLSINERTSDDINTLLGYLAQKKILWVYGTAGTGKTTLLKFLAWQALKPLNVASDKSITPFPIYVDGQDFVEFVRTSKPAQVAFSGGLQDALVDYEVERIIRVTQTTDEKRTMVEGFLRDAMNRREILLLLDELLNGESAFGTDRGFIADGINELFEANFQVVLAQSSDMPGILNTDIKIANNKILVFCPDDIDLFVNKRFKDEQDRAAKFIRILHRYPRVQALTANPFLLRHIVEEYAQDHDSLQRHNHFALYKGCVDKLLGRAEISNALKKLREGGAVQSPVTNEKSQYDELKKLLEHIAWYLHNQKSGMFEHEYQKFDVPNQMLPPRIKRTENPDQWKKRWITYLDILIAKSGLFIPLNTINLGNQQITYKFAYLTLEEYLAASYIRNRVKREQNKLWQELESHRSEPWWEEVLLLSLTPDRGNHLLTSLVQNTPDILASSSVSYVDIGLLEKLIFKTRVTGMNINAPNNGYRPLEGEILSFLMATKCFYAQTRMIYAADEIDFTVIALQSLLGTGNTARLEQLYNRLGKLTIPTALLPLFTGELQNLDFNNHLKICKRFIDLHKETDPSKKEGIIQEFWVNWGDYGSTERIYIAYSLGMLGMMGGEHKNTFMFELIGKLENEEEIGVSWAIAFAITIFSDYSDDLTELLLKILKDGRICVARWNVVNILYIFAIMGKHSIRGKYFVAKELEDLVRNPAHKFEGDSEVIIWNVVALLHALGRFDSNRLADTQQQYNGSSIISEVVGSLMKTDKNIDESINARILSYLKGEIPTSEEDLLHLFDILAKMASSVAKMKNVSEIVKTLRGVQDGTIIPGWLKEAGNPPSKVPKWIYGSILHQVMHIIKDKVESKNGGSLYVR